MAARPHGLDVGQDAVARLRRDDGADVDRQARGVADLELAQRALQHGERAVGHVLLQAQDAQRRAALAGGIEGGGDHVRHHLLGQRRRVHHQGVLPAGLGHERHGRPSGVEAPASWRWISRATAVEPVNITPMTRGVADQRGARPRRRRAGAAARRPARRRRAAAHGLGGDQRRLLGGLGQHRVAGRQRRRDLAGEDGQREVPRADADHRAERRRAARRRGAHDSARSSAGSRRPRAPRRRRWRSSCRLRARRARSAPACGPPGRRRRGAGRRRARRRRRGPGRRGRRGRASAASTSAGRRAGRADGVAPVGRVAAPARRPPVAVCPRGQQRVQRARRSRRGPRRAPPARPRPTGRARASSAASRNRSRGAAMRRCGAPTGSWPRTAATGSATRSSTATASSAMRLTKDELAPFSSSRRTR